MPEIPAKLLTQPTNILLRSATPESADAAGYAIASAINREFVLLEIREHDVPDPGHSGGWAESVSADRHFVVRAPPDPIPAAGVSGGVAWPIVRSDAPGDVLASLDAFLQSPEVGSRVFRDYLPAGRPLAVLVANGAPAARRFPVDPALTGRLLGLQKMLGHTTIFTSDETPRSDYLAFDYAFDVLGSASEPGRLRLRCVRAPGTEALRPGDEIELGKDPSLARAVELPSGEVESHPAGAGPQSPWTTGAGDSSLNASG